jgi:Cu/Ag efflux protein CusF
MKNLAKIAAAVALSATMAVSAFSAEYTKGMVKKFDEKAGKVTITHEALTNLGMPAMTMVFRVGEGIDAEKLKAGSKIEFIAERINGKLTVAEVK